MPPILIASGDLAPVGDPPAKLELGGYGRCPQSMKGHRTNIPISLGGLSLGINSGLWYKGPCWMFLK